MLGFFYGYLEVTDGLYEDASHGRAAKTCNACMQMPCLPSFFMFSELFHHAGSLRECLAGLAGLLDLSVDFS